MKTEVIHLLVHVMMVSMKMILEYVKNVHTNVLNVLEKNLAQFVRMLHIELLHFVIVLMDISMQVKKTVFNVMLNVQPVKELQIIV